MPIDALNSPRRPGWLSRLILGLLFTFSLMGLARAEMQLADVDATLDKLRVQIDAAQKRPRESMGDAEFAELRATLLATRATAEDAAAAITPELAGVEARLAELGTLTAGAKETADIAAQRAQLDKKRSTLDAQAKLARLLAVEGEQAAADVLEQRRARQRAQLGERTASVLTPRFWAELNQEWPTDTEKLSAFGRELRQAVTGKPLWVWLGVVLMLGFLWWVRRPIHRLALHLISTRAPVGRMRRSLHALSELALSTCLPGLAVQVLHAGLTWGQPLPEASASLLSSLVGIIWFGGLITGLGRAVLSPKHPTWRLTPMPDAAALRLRWLPSQLAVMIVLAAMTQRLAALIHVSLATAVATELLVSLALGLSLALALMRMERLRRQALQDEGKAEAQGEQPALRSPPRPLWISLLVGASWLVLTASLICALVGYVAFASFVVKQVVWMAVVLGFAYLIGVLFDDVVMAVLASAQTDKDGEPMEPRVRNQIAVLLSGLGRVVIALVALMLLLARFGEGPEELFRRAEQWQGGISIGEVQLRPTAVLQALLVLVLCLAAVKVVQRWFTQRYLPTTRLDAGMQTSTSTLFGYAGTVMAVALAMSAMGIGLERIAWVASALSVGIGFGLQAVVQNFVSGLILLAERPVKVGDWVSLGGVEGDIRRINVRATEIQMGDRSTVIVPNSEFITKTVRNVTHANPLGLVQIKLPMPLSTDPQQVRDLMLEAFKAHADVLKQPEPSVALDGIDNGRLVFNATGFVSSPRAAYATRSALLFDVLTRLRDVGIALSTPQSVLLSRPEAAIPKDALEPPGRDPAVGAGT